MSALLKRVILTLFCSMSAVAVAASSNYKIGVYYFPGWKDNQRGAPYPLPWDKIKPHPEREPLAGWYQEGQPVVMALQLNWMRAYGLKYVVFDWYIDPKGVEFLGHALDAYLKLQNKRNVEFALMWANHTQYIFSHAQFQAMFELWVKKYLANPNYLRIDGKPVVFLFSADVFAKNAAAIGMTSAQLIAEANQIAVSNGLPGLVFVGGAAGGSQEFDYSSRSGFSGFSAYNFHGPATYRYAGGYSVSHSYEELDHGYRDQWKWMAANSSGLYVVPMTSGWDKRPWGGSSDPLHDNSLGSPGQFEQHLIAARSFMDANPQKTKRLGVVCCWNEYGEGSFVEPTKKKGVAYLEKIRNVFGGAK